MRWPASSRHVLAMYISIPVHGPDGCLNAGSSKNERTNRQPDRPRIQYASYRITDAAARKHFQKLLRNMEASSLAYQRPTWLSLRNIYWHCHFQASQRVRLSISTLPRDRRTGHGTRLQTLGQQKIHIPLQSRRRKDLNLVRQGACARRERRGRLPVPRT